MGFIMDGLNAESYDRSYSDRELVDRIQGYFRRRMPVMLLVASMIVLNALMDTVLPILIARGLDTLTVNLTWRAAAPLVGAILLSGVLSWTFNFGRQWYSARAVGDVVLQLRQDAFAAVLARDLSFFDENPSGTIISRVTSDTQTFSTVVTLTLNLLSQVLLVFLILTGWVSPPYLSDTPCLGGS